jgi:hypothetical protein
VHSFPVILDQQPKLLVVAHERNVSGVTAGMAVTIGVELMFMGAEGGS